MIVTAAQVRAEHEAAMGSLTPAQAKAIERCGYAYVMAHFYQKTGKARLERLFEAEALARSNAPSTPVPDGR